MQRRRMFGISVRILIVLGLLTSWDSSFLLRAQEPAAGNEALRIIVLQGEGYVNNIKKRVARDPVVEVRDRNNKPVAGVAVSFLLPASGAGGSFANGTQMLTLLTNNAGRAAAVGLKPNTVAGLFKISVTASFQGQTATVAITQTNALAGAAAGGAAGGTAGGATAGTAAGAGGIAGLGVGATVGIIGAVAAATAVTVAKVATGGGKTARVSVGPPSLP